MPARHVGRVAWPAVMTGQEQVLGTGTLGVRAGCSVTARAEHSGGGYAASGTGSGCLDRGASPNCPALLVGATARPTQVAAAVAARIPAHLLHDEWART